MNTVWFSTLLFSNKINPIINCTSTESVSPIYWNHTNTYILPASNQSPFSILVHWNHPQSLKNKNRNWCLHPFPPVFFFKLVYYKPGFLNPSDSNTDSQGWKITVLIVGENPRLQIRIWGALRRARCWWSGYEATLQWRLPAFWQVHFKNISRRLSSKLFKWSITAEEQPLAYWSHCGTAGPAGVVLLGKVTILSAQPPLALPLGSYS